MLKKAAIYMGFGPDSHYARYDEARRESEEVGDVRPIHQPPNNVTELRYPPETSGVRPVPINPEPGANPTSPVAISTNSNYRGPMLDPLNFSPIDFTGELQDIADAYLTGRVVIVYLGHMEEADRRRMIDFSSGLCYAKGGKVKRVGEDVIQLNLTGSEETT